MTSIQNFESFHNDDVRLYLPKVEAKAAPSFKSLSTRTLEVVVDNFNELCTKTSTIPPKLLMKILQAIPPGKVEYSVGAEFVHCEDFYKRASTEKYGNGKCILGSHGLSWKRLYYEKLFCELLGGEIREEINDVEFLDIVSERYHFNFC